MSQVKLPGSFSVPKRIAGGENILLKWDRPGILENGLAGGNDGIPYIYVLEKQVNDEDPWSERYRGGARTFRDYITHGCETVQYRIKTCIPGGGESDWFYSDTMDVDNNRAPTISDFDMNLGDVTIPPVYSFTVDDPDSEQDIPITLRLRQGFKSQILSQFLAEKGKETLAGMGSGFLELDSTPAQLIVTAKDEEDAAATRRISFRRKIDRVAASRSFETAEPVQKCLVALYPVDRSSDRMLTLEVCNNPFDLDPVWEDISTKANRDTHTFGNTYVQHPGFAYRFAIAGNGRLVEVDRVNVRYE